MKITISILSSKRPINQKGVAYLSLLLVLALISIASMGALTVASLTERRQAEEELLFVGEQFRAALTSFANSTPPGMARGPRSIEELLLDRRTNVSRRHLRKLYFDPITKENNWGILRGADGTIVGIYSQSEATPIKIDLFPTQFSSFKGALSYRNWVFRSVL